MMINGGVDSLWPAQSVGTCVDGENNIETSGIHKHGAQRDVLPIRRPVDEFEPTRARVLEIALLDVLKWLDAQAVRLEAARAA